MYDTIIIHRPSLSFYGALPTKIRKILYLLNIALILLYLNSNIIIHL